MIYEQEINIVRISDGEPGISAGSLFTWIVYADDDQGTNLSNDYNNQKYMGVAYNKTDQVESTNPSDYTFSLIKGNDGLDAYTIVLSKDSQSIGTTSDLKPLSATTYNCVVSVYNGISELTATTGTPTIGEFKVTLPSNPAGLTLAQSTAGIVTFTTSTSAVILDSGTINLTITIGGVSSTIAKTISYSASSTGATARTYFLDAETLVIKKGADSVLSPSTVTFSSYYRDGTSESKTSYAGRFIVQESTDGGVTWTTRSTSSSNVTSVLYTPSSSSVTTVKCTMYAAGGTTTALDSKIVVVLVDVDNIVIGGRNYALGTGVPKTLTGFSGSANYCTDVYKVLIDKSWKVGDKLTMSCDVSYTELMWTDTRNICWIQWGASIGDWNAGRYFIKPESGTSGTIHVERSFSLTPDHLTNDFCNVSIRTDYITGGSITWENLMVECATKASSWQPAPEDIQFQITTVTETISGVSSKVDANEKSITDKVWQSDITTTIDNYDGTTGKKIRDRVTSVEQDIGGITTVITDIGTTIGSASDTSGSSLYANIYKVQETANGIITTVSQVQTNLDDLTIGGRNYALGTSIPITLTGFSGGASYTSSYIVLVNNEWKVGDTITVSCDINYTNLTWENVNTLLNIQGNGDVAGWGNGSFAGFVVMKDSTLPVSGTSGTIHVEYYFKLTSDHLTNNYWNVMLRADYITGGSITWKNFMIEHATKASSWQPAPEDMATQSQFTQLAGDIDLKVQKNDIISQVNLSTEGVLIAGEKVHITGQTIIDDAVITSANIASIDAGKITTGILNADLIEASSITAAKLNISDLSAIGATIGGWDINTEGLYKGKTSLSADTDGVFMSTDGIRFQSSDNFVINSGIEGWDGTIVNNTRTVSMHKDGLFESYASRGAIEITEVKTQILGDLIYQYEYCLGILRSVSISPDNILFRRGSGGADGKFTYINEEIDLIGTITTLKSSYLPLTGGTLSGALTVSSGAIIASNGDLKGTNVSASGTITATGAIYANSDIYVASAKYIYFGGNARITSAANQQLYLGASNETNYHVFLGVRDSMWGFGPRVSGNVSLGSPNYRWGTVYANTGTINTSDRNEKNTIEPLDPKLWCDFINNLEPVTYRLNGGESGRKHTGLIAQDVEVLMESMGIDSKDFAGLIKFAKCDEDGNEVLDARGNTVYGYGLRYEEFISPIIVTVQELHKETEILRSVENFLKSQNIDPNDFMEFVVTKFNKYKK